MSDGNPLPWCQRDLPEERFGRTRAVCGVREDLQGLGCVNCCCLGPRWTPAPLWPCRRSAHPQRSVGKRARLPEHHLRGRVAQPSRMFSSDLRVLGGRREPSRCAWPDGAGAVVARPRGASCFAAAWCRWCDGRGEVSRPPDHPGGAWDTTSQQGLAMSPIPPAPEQALGVSGCMSPPEQPLQSSAGLGSCLRPSALQWERGGGTLPLGKAPRSLSRGADRAPCCHSHPVAFGGKPAWNSPAAGRGGG